MSTSGYSSHTPKIELIKWVDTLQTTDVFDVVFGSIPCYVLIKVLEFVQVGYLDERWLMF